MVSSFPNTDSTNQARPTTMDIPELKIDRPHSTASARMYQYNVLVTAVDVINVVVLAYINKLSTIMHAMVAIVVVVAVYRSLL